MFKYIIIFVFLFFQSKAQINNQSVIGDWTKVKFRTLDGSKDLSEPYNVSKYYNWKISTTKICMRMESVYPNANYCYDYKMNNKVLQTTPTSGYEIEKLEKDSLILFEKIDGKTEKDKIQKIWFVKTSKITNEEIEKHKDDSILIAYPLYTPQMKVDFMSEVAKNFNKKNNYPDLLFKGNYIIYPKKQRIEFQSDDKSIFENKNFLLLKSIAENNFNNWDLKNFEHFEKIYIPFIFESKYERLKSGGTFKGARIYFFMNDFKDIPKVYGPKMEDMELAQENFKKAVSFMQNQKYEKAIEYFNKGYELNNTKVDALYNIVSLYSQLKDKDNMCLTLKRLKDLEQTDGTKLYNEYCIK